MSDLTLIRRRKAEVTDELNRLQSRIGELQGEYRDLGVAERVLERLSGNSGGDVGEGDEQSTARPANSKPAGVPSVPEMILGVLEDAKIEGLRGLEPKDMTTRIQRRWWPDMRPEATNSIAWRMWKREQLVKDGPVYMLPKKEEAADANLAGGTSTASDNSDLLG